MQKNNQTVKFIYTDHGKIFQLSSDLQIPSESAVKLIIFHFSVYPPLTAYFLWYIYSSYQVVIDLVYGPLIQNLYVNPIKSKVVDLATQIEEKPIGCFRFSQNFSKNDAANTQKIINPNRFTECNAEKRFVRNQPQLLL